MCVSCADKCGWKTVFTESKGSGNGAQFDNSDLRTLNLVNPPFNITNGNYKVRMEWGSSTPSEYAEFTVPANSNVFGSKQNLNIHVTNVKTSSSSIKMGSTAHFCHACVKNGYRWGDTCWGLISKDSSHRSCGCNSGSWQGFGIYYGGYKKPQVCDGQGGGFSGPKTNGQAKGNLASVGLTIKISQSTCQVTKGVSFL